MKLAYALFFLGCAMLLLKVVGVTTVTWWVILAPFYLLMAPVLTVVVLIAMVMTWNFFN